MNDLETYRTRKNGEYTPLDVIERATETIKEHGSKRVTVIIQTEDDEIHRINTELDNVELSGLLEVAKISELTDAGVW